jgi:multicomponent Na+:H+ antiporter subunit E
VAKAKSRAIDLRGFVAVLGRFAAFLGFWLVLIGFSTTNLIVGFVAASAATWVSLQLLAAAPRQPSYSAMAWMLLCLPWQSLVAGIDVARRAFDPRMPLRTGFVAFPSRLPPGPARATFRALMSLQPGSLPVSTEDHGDILFHCLDTEQPVAAQLAAAEARFLRVLGQEGRNA